MKSRVLVVGATGLLGQPVAQALLEQGWLVRCLVRNLVSAKSQLGTGFEYVEGDVTRPETLDVAFEGCTYLHINLRGHNTAASYERQEINGAVNCASAARRHGIHRITYLSGAGKMDGSTSHLLPVRVKQTVEAALARSGVTWTIFRATHFMESLALCVRGNRASILGRQPHPLHYVAARDYASMVSRSLDCAGAKNRTLCIFGPQAFTMKEALQQYVQVLRPELKVSTLPLPVARLIAAVTRNEDLRFACMLFAAFEQIGEAGDPKEANRLLGPPSTTLHTWLETMTSARAVK